MKTIRSDTLINQFEVDGNASDIRSKVNTLKQKIQQRCQATKSRKSLSGTKEQNSIAYQNRNCVTQMGVSSSELSSDVESHQFPVRKMIRSVGKKQKTLNSLNKCYNSKRKMTHIGNVFFGVECKNRYSILLSTFSLFV